MELLKRLVEIILNQATWLGEYYEQGMKNIEKKTLKSWFNNQLLVVRLMNRRDHNIRPLYNTRPKNGIYFFCNITFIWYTQVLV